MRKMYMMGLLITGSLFLHAEETVEPVAPSDNDIFPKTNVPFTQPPIKKHLESALTEWDQENLTEPKKEKEQEQLTLESTHEDPTGIVNEMIFEDSNESLEYIVWDDTTADEEEAVDMPDLSTP